MSASTQIVVEIEDHKMNKITGENIRIAYFAFLFFELLIDSYVIGRDLLFLSKEHLQLHPVLHPFRKLYKFDIKRSIEYTKEERWLLLQDKVHVIVMLLGIIHLDLISLAWTTSFVDSTFDFTADILSLETRQNLSFAIWVALFESFILDLPMEFFKMKLNTKYGLYDRSVRHWMRYALEDALSETICSTAGYFLMYISLQTFFYHASTFSPLLQFAIIFFSYIFIITMIVSMVVVLRSMNRETFISLPEGLLKQKLSKICVLYQYDIKNVKILVVPPSMPPNAYSISFFGLVENIVLFSSIIEGYYAKDVQDEEDVKGKGLSVRELEGIFSHELGHWRDYHSEITFLVDVVPKAIMLSLGVFLCNQNTIFEAMHFPEEALSGTLPLLPGILIIRFILMRALQYFVRLAQNILSQHFEYEADKSSIKNAYSQNLQEGLVGLHADDLEYPETDKWYSRFFLSHPNLVERIENILFFTFGKK